MTAEHRHEAQATLTPAVCEHGVGGARLQLVAVALTDGPTTPDDQAQQPDVICQLRPSEARRLATRLLELSDHAEHPGRR